MRAIETRYAGHRFRSRIEARWAVFFDALAVPYEYEREGYELPSGNYLPDFWLPTIRDGMWLEIKGVQPTGVERQLARQLAEATSNDVAIAYGDIPSTASADANDSMEIYTDEGMDVSYEFNICDCGRVGVEFTGYASRVCSSHMANDGLGPAAIARLNAAYTAARSARFEHGEVG